MGFRVRKSIKIVPGVRLNLSGSGVGYSVGGKGMRVTRHANGRVSRSVSIPGTGVSHVQTLRPAPRKASSPRRPAPHDTPPPPRPTAPGFMAPAWEKDLFKVLDTTNGADYVRVSRSHGHAQPGVRVLAASLEGLLHYTRGFGNPDSMLRARHLLSWAVAIGAPLELQPFVSKYLAEKTWSVQVAEGVTAELRLRDDVILLAAAELHQFAGDLDVAIWTVEQAQPTAVAALSLTELYSESERHQDVVDLTNGITNLDDATALLLALRGRAFAQIGYLDAGREALRSALTPKRAQPIRHRALLERAEIDLMQNRKAAARKTLETILAENPAYPGLAEAMNNLP